MLYVTCNAICTSMVSAFSCVCWTSDQSIDQDHVSLQLGHGVAWCKWGTSCWAESVYSVVSMSLQGERCPGRQACERVLSRADFFTILMGTNHQALELPVAAMGDTAVLEFSESMNLLRHTY